ncbi:MAG: hypothetical protein A2445_03545 [Candidatus Jacksonbacteria bacterium RIFOXYC2_FULL_44_29]|nr:MAG: hypothetical protein A2240_03070 [Candidatus Jacksonbacteria bacterium RIFOXYA2_FULL_43_12]OGY76965.1 MAG: hypothetical protein A2295_01180 [Candidatus Jacksonbacteria bacterium RIFOXYB2_FULL_44_15]OGY79125.1 MAG: hypothetical protein A2550_01440 [Candidatus Jacksonbacteria bacterium RIFOXYD2_FULL_43_21]OGY80500.1 MAG: hypothetical protein A2445_03545 [Candidatus Jacksonbacteria bacterium RIFOXYC2_FULL_44_29]HCC49670.1 hypothetical protein [Candidatus Jacksonbacteria bacterium]
MKNQSKNKAIAIFEGAQIRRQWDEEKELWYFSVVDVVGALTGSTIPKRYWSDLKNKLNQEGSEVYEKIVQLKFVAKDGKYYASDAADTETMLRLIQSIPSPNAEPFKLWLARVGYERLEETADPELAINRALKTYLQKGYSPEWVNQRLKSIEIRKALTDEWEKRGVKEGLEFAILTDEITKAWTGMTTKEYKRLKDLKKENLRDNMTNLELVLNMLAETATTEISEKREPKNLDENKTVAREGGSVAGNARKDIETKTGKSVLTNKNAKILRGKILKKNNHQSNIIFRGGEIKKYMRKIISIIFFAVLALALPGSVKAAGLANADNAYQAIVKIKTYSLSVDSALIPYAQGSGVIISGSGLVLTNYHVVSLTDPLDNSDFPTVFQICVTKAIEQEPDCNYAAKLINQDENLDIALLQMQSVSGLSLSDNLFYLDLNTIDNTAIGDKVTVLGYPAIGGDTVTISKGSISGKSEKYDEKWIKTDAVVSFGDSGGATIDVNGKVIGITTAAYSDYLGSLGYVNNIVSLIGWISAHRQETPPASPLMDRMLALVRKQEEIKTSNIFTKDYPSFTITKPADWDFTYANEVSVRVAQGANEEGGDVSFSLLKKAYLMSKDNIVPEIKRAFNAAGKSSLFTITAEQDITINGYSGKLVTISSLGEIAKLYYIPYQEYLILITYQYGTDDQDKTVVDGIINSLRLKSTSQTFTEVHEYSNATPKFYITAGSDWAILPRVGQAEPLLIMSKTIKPAYVLFSVTKLSADLSSLDNQGYLDYQLQKIKEANQIVQAIDYKIDVVSSNAHYKLNDELTDVIKIEEIEKLNQSGEPLTYDTEYYIRSGDYIVHINLSVYGKDKAVYDQAVPTFNELMQTLSLKELKALATSAPTSAAPTTSANSAPSGQTVVQAIPVKDLKMYNRLKGKIIVRTQFGGAAYYVHPDKAVIYYLGRPESAFAVMRENGIGISNANLNRIAVSVDNLSGPDTDKDGLPDLLEGAIGTDSKKSDTDGDYIDDKTEIKSGLNPSGAAKSSVVANYSSKHLGKIFLQIETAGEAWYVNPQDGKRYFLGRPVDAFKLMSKLGLGISENDFAKLIGE